LTYFTSQDRNRYSAILSNISAQLPQAFSSIQDFEMISFEGEIAEAEAVRSENGSLYSYPVVFGLDLDGIWRLKGL
jgi:hypothetical protein